MTHDMLEAAAGLASPATRREAAAALARAFGCESLLLFVRDDEVGALLSAPGFPQTLPDGRAWRAFLAQCAARGEHHGSLPMRAGDPVPSVGYGSDGMALVLVGIGGSVPDTSWFRTLLPLVGAVLAGERAASYANVNAELARESAARAATLAGVVDRTRRKLEDALAAAHGAEEELLATNAQLQDQAMEMEAANEQLHEQTAAMEEQTAKLVAMNEALVLARKVAEEANQAKSEFLATMSHELRTPLNAISGHLQLLDMGLYGPITAPQRETLQRIDRSQRHLLSLINDVLNLARIESGKLEYDITSVPLAEAIGDMAPMIEPQLRVRGHSYMPPRGDLPTVAADREKLQQILLNLLSNAAKFTHPGGHICLEVREPRDQPDVVRIVVVDNGPGIPPDKCETVFEPFMQVDGSHSRTGQGAGLGLAISRDLARGMHGDLTVRSIFGEGSEFTLELPRLPQGASTGQLDAPSSARAVAGP